MPSLESQAKARQYIQNLYRLAGETLPDGWDDSDVILSMASEMEVRAAAKTDPQAGEIRDILRFHKPSTPPATAKNN